MTEIAQMGICRDSEKYGKRSCGMCPLQGGGEAEIDVRESDQRKLQIGM